MTASRPRFDADDLAVTHDELEPVRVEPVADPYFDAPRGHPLAPETRDVHDRLSALEAALPSAAVNALWIRRIAKLGASMLGLGGAFLAWALYTARAKGDADATSREREAERRWLVESVRALDRAVSEVRGELRARNPIGMLPLIGPPNEPKEPNAP